MSTTGRSQGKFKRIVVLYIETGERTKGSGGRPDSRRPGLTVIEDGKDRWIDVLRDWYRHEMIAG